MCGPTAHPLKRSNSKQSCATTISNTANSSRGTLSDSSYTSTSLRNLIYLQEWTDVISICISNPCEAKIIDRTGDLPLHEACLHGAPLNVIESLLSAYPHGVRQKGFCGRLPLHYAVYNKPSLDTIRLLLRKFPQAVSTGDLDGRLPIHLAVIRNAPKQNIEALIVAYPKSLRIANKFGSTPQMLARNDIVYSILSSNKASSRTVLHKRVVKNKSAKMCNVSNARSAKSKLPLNTSRQTVKKLSKAMNEYNAGVARNSLPIKKGRQASTGVAGKKKGPPPKILQFSALPFTKTTHATRSVKRSHGMTVSRLIQKHELNSEKSDMNRIRRRKILCSTLSTSSLRCS